MRVRAGLKTQTAAAKRPGAPNNRNLSFWERGRKEPSLRLLNAYLQALGLDFHALQDALDQLGERPLAEVEDVASLAEDLAALERRVAKLEGAK